jgi:hypothetical protein
MQEGNHFQKKDINEVKQRILAKIDERINKMNENKNCVNSATTFDALKMCKPKRHEGEERMEDKK